MYGPDNYRDLFCGKPLLIFHDENAELLNQFCIFLPPAERCTRIVINQKNAKIFNQNIIYVYDQTEAEIEIWYASADAVITTQHVTNVLLSKTECVSSIEQYFS